MGGDEAILFKSDDFQNYSWTRTKSISSVTKF